MAEHRTEVREVSGVARCSCGWGAGPFILVDQAFRAAEEHEAAVREPVVWVHGDDPPHLSAAEHAEIHDTMSKALGLPEREEGNG